MKNVKVGQVCEISGGDSVVVTAVYPTTRTVDLDYTEMAGLEHASPPGSFLSRPTSEIVDLGNGRIIWNNEA